MKRARILRLPAASIAVALVTAGVAWAAASPTVTTGAATKVTQTSAVLNGTVNPNGSKTTYSFQVGPTTAYGSSTTVKSAGKGTAAVAATGTVTGLTPGTVYHYRITATNGSGSTVGADRTFTTTGPPLAGVVTGPAVNVSQTAATVTGTVNPEGAATTWSVQWGSTTTPYPYQTAAEALPAGAQPVPVSVQLTGLAPETLFHYRIVAIHAGGFTSTGADQTFFTEPVKPLKPRLVAHTAPGRDARSPYAFTTHGYISNVGVIPQAQRCTGRLGIRYYNGRRQVAFVLAPIGSDCRFAIPATFKRLRGVAPAQLAVKVTFRGNAYVDSAETTDHVTAG